MTEVDVVKGPIESVTREEMVKAISRGNEIRKGS